MHDGTYTHTHSIWQLLSALYKLETASFVLNHLRQRLRTPRHFELGPHFLSYQSWILQSWLTSAHKDENCNTFLYIVLQVTTEAGRKEVQLAKLEWSLIRVYVMELFPILGKYTYILCPYRVESTSHLFMPLPSFAEGGGSSETQLIYSRRRTSDCFIGGSEKIPVFLFSIVLGLAREDASESSQGARAHLG